jgi:transketolase N-terminal domain/subunit
MQTGVVWESLMAAARQRSIPKLVVLVDANGFQSVGRVDKLDVTSAMLQAVASVFIEIDGHDIVQILDALAHCSVSDGLSVIWARTKRGAGLAGFDEAWPMSSLAEPELVAAWLAALGG